MNYVIAVFKSRSETMSFYSILGRFGVQSNVVPTPKEAGRTCGLSVRFSYNDFSHVKEIMSRFRFQSFQGFYIIENNNFSRK